MLQIERNRLKKTIYTLEKTEDRGNSGSRREFIVL